MVSKAIINTTDVRSDISMTDVQSVLAVTLLAAEVVLDPDPKNRWFYDQFSFADLPTFGFGKNPADTLTLSDAISQIGFSTAKSDAVTVSENISVLLEIFRAFSDLISFVDAPAIETSRGFLDQQQMSESDTKSFSAVKADSLSFSDSEFLNFGKAPSDQAVMSESISLQVGSNRSFADAFSLDDTASAEAIGTEKTNVFSFADAQAFGFGKSAIDSFSLSESIDSFVFGKGVTDAVSVTENINVLLFSNAAMNASTLNSAPFNQ